jgi:hypothetical protein
MSCGVDRRPQGIVALKAARFSGVSNGLTIAAMVSKCSFVIFMLSPIKIEETRKWRADAQREQCGVDDVGDKLLHELLQVVGVFIVKDSFAQCNASCKFVSWRERTRRVGRW